jgi:CysZ protein
MSQHSPPIAPAAAPGPGPAATAQAPLLKRPGFWAGLVAFFSGFGFLMATPGVWLPAMVPVTIAIVLSSGLGYGAYRVVPGWIAGAIGPTTSTLGGFAAALAEVTATLLAIMAALLIGFALAQPLSSPALERIVRRREASLGAPTWPPTSILEDVLRSIQSVLVSSVFGLPLLGVLFLADLLIPGAMVVTFPLKILVTAMLIAWDLCDYPLSLRGIPVLQRVSLIGRYLWPMLGFGVGLSLLSILPCMLLLVLPAGVAGATRLVCEIERWEQHRRGGGHTPAALPL